MSSDERDVLQPRPNPLRPFQCGFREVGVHCVPGPTDDGQCCQSTRGGCDIGDCGDNCVNCDNCTVAAKKQISPSDRLDFRACVPVRSHWFTRKSLALNLAVLVAGILLIVLASRKREHFFVPGPLSQSHSQILENTLLADRCGLCHTSAHGLKSSGTQDALCMNCHSSHMPSAALRHPHDIAPAQFAQLVSLRSGEPTLSQAQFDQQTSCAQCHVEHHGAHNDLKAISGERCQSCHQAKYHSFSKDHAEFQLYPKPTNRRIGFDHRAHAEKYFGQKAQIFECRLCHNRSENDPTEIVRATSFEQACAQCHQEPLRNSVQDGWAVIQLPSLDSTSSPTTTQSFTNWPASAQYGYDGKISLPLYLLLISDSKASAALQRFPGGDLSRVNAQDAQQVAAFNLIAQQIRQVFSETATMGQSAWQTRLSTVLRARLSREPNQSEQLLIEQMVAGISPDLFQQIESRWFGRAGGIALSSPIESQMTLVSGPQQLLSDREVDTQLLQDDLLDDESMSADELLKAPSTDAISDSNPPTTPTPDRPKLTAIDSIRAGGWYLDNELLILKYMPSGHADSVLAAWIQFAELVDTASMAGAETESAAFDHRQMIDNVARSCRQCHLLPTSASSTASEHHWQASQPPQHKAFTKFNHKPHVTLSVTSDCKHCHEFDAEQTGRYRDLQDATSQPRSHAAQLVATQAHFHSEFKAMNKSQCAACHRPNGAPENCTQCHNYHVSGEFIDSTLK